MAGRTLKLLILSSLLSLTQPFEVKEDDWEELDLDIAALHRLRGLSQHMVHETLHRPPAQRITSMSGAEVFTASQRVDANQNPMSWQDALQECENFTACVIHMEQDFDGFLAHIDEQKLEDWLISASETSHSYSQKLLVMIDEEESTNDRVQQEYSMDPHYSVIVNKDCLNNDSCVPGVDGYTVVKIFGNVSEDGQTVSGLSGSSLANLVLKPSLEAAPVFSLDGNTTTEFQNHFLHVLKVRDVQAVLETNKGNHKIYQVMDQSDSVSRYQIPQRPVDHSTQYDHQQILILEDDPVVRKAAISLYDKHPTVSSVYNLDKNQRPKLIYGESVPLSEDSRLVLVGHGAKDSSGEMRLSGFKSQDVAKIIQRTSRVGDKIKTTSVVACDVGSDTLFIKTMMKELSAAGIKTELHLKNAEVQVLHTGQKITQEISPDGVQWRQKDDSKKVVATLDRNGQVIIRDKAGSKGEAIFTKERNFLGKTKKKGRQPKKAAAKVEEEVKTWPDEPKKFINPDSLNYGDQNKIDQRKYACDELESLSWGLFHSEQQTPTKVNINNQQQIEQHFVIAEKEGNNIKWIDSEQRLRKVLQDCYEIKSGKDVRNVIRHYAKNPENRFTYLMVNDWIYVVDPKSLYVFPVGKKLDNNQIGDQERIKEVKKCISAQVGKESYTAMRGEIKKPGDYVRYVQNTFLGQRDSHPPPNEAWLTTYFTASIIAESVRNFRTFPLTLMALDMTDSFDNKGKEFLFDQHPMARGGSWIDPDRRGFDGTAATENAGKLEKLKEVIDLEVDMFTKWQQTDNNNVLDRITEIAETYQIFENSDAQKSFSEDYKVFKERAQPYKPTASGSLGGHEDGDVTPRDLKSASEFEMSVKHESYYSRASAFLAEEIHVQLKAKYGENLAGLTVKEGTARIENGQFVCELVSEGTEAIEFRTELSLDSQYYYEKMLKNIDTAVHDMEVQSSNPPHEVNKYVERAGNVVGSLGLMMGMQGAVRAFEHGDIGAGVAGTLQTAQGVAAMTTAVIGKQALSSEARVAKAASAVMRSPAMKGFTTAIPIVGIGFGIYNFAEDIKRGDTLGYIDASLDGLMVVLDIVELAQPELAPFIAPVNLALSVVRMVIDDVYMGIKDELSSLPKDAGVLEKIGAVFVGLGKGIVHFLIQVASLFYNWHYEEIEEGRRLVAQISDYNKYYKVVTEKDGTTAIDFTGGDASWNGGGINFCLADQGLSKFCMDYFVSSDESLGKRCWEIDAHESKDITLGLGESNQLQYKTLQKKVLLFIPAGSVTVVSGYEALSYSRYGKYTGNRDSNRFFAVQTSEDNHMMEVMLTYYYSLYGAPGDDIFYLGPQKNYVEGSGGKDTYMISENGGKTIINNYDPLKAPDTLHFSVSYSHISVSKSGDNVVLQYESSHTVTIQNWFLGEQYRHMNLMSGDGVSFEISPIVVSSVQLVARGINKMFQENGQTVDTSQPLLQTVTNILGSPFDDVLIGNEENNLIDGAGGRDRLIGGEGEDIYMIKGRKQSTVMIENHSSDNKTDLAIIEANLHTFKVTVEDDDVHLKAQHNNTDFHVTLVNWFRSPADRNLLIVTEDLITFSVSDIKTDCLQSDVFKKCIQSRSIDFSHSTSALVVDLQEDETLQSVTEVRGSEMNDVIKGNKEHNVINPGKGDDFMEGRGGEDWYIITPGQGLKTINNLSPDLNMDLLFLKEQYENITCTCEGQSIFVLVHGRRTVILLNWFVSKNYQHLQMKTSDGITAGLKTNISSCGETFMLPLTVDYRNQEPEPLQSIETHLQKRSGHVGKRSVCYTYRTGNSEPIRLCGLTGKVMMMMKDAASVKEMYGSSGFDIMVGNNNENLLDPYIGGALMSGGEGKDTYIIKRGYGKNIMIDNFAEDGITDTVLMDMDFLGGSQVTFKSFFDDLTVTIMTKEEEFAVKLLNYMESYQHQHLEFLSSDGVHFKLNSLNSTGSSPLFQIEAFKVTLKESQVDSYLDLSSQRNLSKVHSVQGCSSQSNHILGNNQNNILIGGWKDDALNGDYGDDTLIGGNGSDILIGGLGDDILYGEDGNDTLMGDSGRDVFIPGPGADVMDGGLGRDTVLYHGDHQKGEGVYVNLLIGQGQYADAEGDVLKDVENVIGTIYSDILVSGYESSLLQGSDGNDVLVSTGEDYLVGGDGNDIYMLAFKNGSVTIDNCAKDNATDVLYLSSHSPATLECQLLPDKVLLTFPEIRQTMKVALRGWVSDDDECGHLVLVLKEAELSVDRLLQECQSRRNKAMWSLIITCLICISLFLIFCGFLVPASIKFIRAARQQKTQQEADAVPMSSDAM